MGILDNRLPLAPFPRDTIVPQPRPPRLIPEEQSDSRVREVSGSAESKSVDQIKLCQAAVQ